MKCIYDQSRDYLMWLTIAWIVHENTIFHFASHKLYWGKKSEEKCARIKIKQKKITKKKKQQSCIFVYSMFAYRMSSVYIKSDTIRLKLRMDENNSLHTNTDKRPWNSSLDHCRLDFYSEFVKIKDDDENKWTSANRMILY